MSLKVIGSLEGLRVMKLEELQVYQLSMELAEKIWNVIDSWNYFARSTLGKQLIRAADSIAANLSEGFGRYYYKENKQFCFYSRGSLFEVKTWLSKAHNRNLISDEEFSNFDDDLTKLGIKLNNYIKSIGRKSKQNDQ